MNAFYAASRLPIAATSTPDWLTATLAIAAVLLALLAVAFMFRRVDVSERQVSDGDASQPETPRDFPAVYYDPVLVVSALGVIGLAIAAWLLR